MNETMGRIIAAHRWSQRVKRDPRNKGIAGARLVSIWESERWKNKNIR